MRIALAMVLSACAGAGSIQYGDDTVDCVSNESGSPSSETLSGLPDGATLTVLDCGEEGACEPTRYEIQADGRSLIASCGLATNHIEVRWIAVAP